MAGSSSKASCRLSCSVVLGQAANFLESTGFVLCAPLLSAYQEKAGETEKVFSWSRFLSDVEIGCDSALQPGSYTFCVAK